MSLKISGTSILDKKGITEVYDFIVQYLEMQKIDNNSFIHLKLNQRRSDYGQCKRLTKTHYEIKLNKDVSFDKKLLINILAHEMVHVRQFYLNELEYLMTGVRFRKKIFDPQKLDYYKYPWEIEANGLAEGVLVRFLQQ